MLHDTIHHSGKGLVFYSLTPPKITTDQDRVISIAHKQIERLKGIPLDGLLLYDIQDESARTDEERTYKFVPTISPEHYAKNHLAALSIPKIVYKSISNLTQKQFHDWLLANQSLEYAVFVGASSSSQTELTKFALNDAYALKKKDAPNIVLGGVTIPERHTKRGNEHLRIFDKIDSGCKFFVSQCVYSLNDTKNLLSDYYYTALENSREMCPIVFTLTPCGSLKTLKFMEWLGIEVPKWLYNDLKHSKDILASSVETCKNIALEIIEFAENKKMPIGFNIESVSIRKDEIDASDELLKEILKMMK